MSATYAAGGSRQTVILSAIIALHFGLFVLIASGLGPQVVKALTPGTPIKLILKSVEPAAVVAPDTAVPLVPYELRVIEPTTSYPEFDAADDAPNTSAEAETTTAGSGAGISSSDDYLPPALGTRNSRLAALIDSCYPAASRRLGEEGRAVARVAIDGGAHVISWSVAESSGFPRLDAALGCVIEQLVFIAGRRDGRGVETEALLPIVFRLD